VRVLSGVKSFWVSCVRHFGIIFIFRKSFGYGYGTFRMFFSRGQYTHPRIYSCTYVYRELFVRMLSNYFSRCLSAELAIYRPDEVAQFEPNPPKQTELNSTQTPTHWSFQPGSHPFKCRILRYAHPIKSIKTTKNYFEIILFSWNPLGHILLDVMCVCMQNMYADIYKYFISAMARIGIRMQEIRWVRNHSNIIINNQIS